VLGLIQQDPASFVKKGIGTSVLADAEIEALLVARREARAGKNFSESDRIRDTLLAAGIILEDKAGGTTVWRRA
jgi:cysteinyl-tRNA synthetase